MKQNWTFWFDLFFLYLLWLVGKNKVECKKPQTSTFFFCLIFLVLNCSLFLYWLSMITLLKWLPLLFIDLQLVNIVSDMRLTYVKKKDFKWGKTNFKTIVVWRFCRYMGQYLLLFLLLHTFFLCVCVFDHFQVCIISFQLLKCFPLLRNNSFPCPALQNSFRPRTTQLNGWKIMKKSASNQMRTCSLIKTMGVWHCIVSQASSRCPSVSGLKVLCLHASSMELVKIASGHLQIQILQTCANLILLLVSRFSPPSIWLAKTSMMNV